MFSGQTHACIDAPTQPPVVALPADPPLTRAEAQALQDHARGTWLIWFVSTSDPGHPGKAVAWAIAADTRGGTRPPGLLIADTLDELRAILPTGLTRRERTSVMPAQVVETWD